MKKFFAIAFVLSIGLIIISCSDVRRRSGATYMPDMAYSRALETYAALDTGFTSDTNARGKGKYFYNARPVPGTIAIGDEIPFPYKQDKPGDSTNYVGSKSLQNPLQSLDFAQMTEAERLYLVNCAICHGPKLDGNGPLYNNGKGPYAAAPKNFINDAIVSKMPDGQMFYSITYGKNQMGSYASQLSTHQRWMIIRYIKSKQSSSAGGKTDSTAANAPKDSTAVQKK
jgi:mono/diheme cytochrome c family protein